MGDSLLVECALCECVQLCSLTLWLHPFTLLELMRQDPYKLQRQLASRFTRSAWSPGQSSRCCLSVVHFRLVSMTTVELLLRKVSDALAPHTHLPNHSSGGAPQNGSQSGPGALVIIYGGKTTNFIRRRLPLLNTYISTSAFSRLEAAWSLFDTGISTQACVYIARAL